MSSSLPQKKELSAVLNKLKQMREVQGVYLFGSHARGKAAPLSDVDLAVITTPLPESKKTEIVLAGPNHFDISLLDDLPPAISFRVFKEGKPLWIKNQLFVHRRKMRAISDYLDYQPMIERMTKKVFGNDR